MKAVSIVVPGAAIFLVCACNDSSISIPPGRSDGAAAVDGGAVDGGQSADAGHVPLQGCNTARPGVICAGAARRTLTPATYETVKPEYLSDGTGCVGGGTTCGTLSKQKLLDLDKACRAGQCPCPVGREKCKWNDAYFNDDDGDGKFGGYWIAGFGYGRPMQGVHDDPEVRAAVFRRDGITVAIAAADLIGLMDADVDKIRRMIQLRNPELGLTLLVFQSLHDHAAIDTIGLWGPEDPYSGIWVIPEEGGGGANPAYVEFVQERTVEAVVEATTGMKEATIAAAVARIGIDGLCNDIRDPFILDDTLTVLDVNALDGTRIATVANWGCHPEATGGGHNLVSAEYPGVLRSALEQGLPAAGGNPAREGLGGTAIFLQGALGGMATPIRADIRTREGAPTPEDSFERMQAMGEALAGKVFTVLDGAVPIADTVMSQAVGDLRLEVDNSNFIIGFTIGILRDRALHKIDPSNENLFNNTEIDTRIAAVRIGPVTFGTMPGEPFPELAVGGFAPPYDWSFGRPIVDPANPAPPDLTQAPAGPFLRATMPGDYKILMTLTMDQIGYIIPSYDYKPGAKDHYEEDVSLGDVQPKLFDGFSRVMDAVR